MMKLEISNYALLGFKKESAKNCWTKRNSTPKKTSCIETLYRYEAKLKAKLEKQKRFKYIS